MAKIGKTCNGSRNDYRCFYLIVINKHIHSSIGLVADTIYYIKPHTKHNKPWSSYNPFKTSFNRIPNLTHTTMYSITRQLPINSQDTRPVSTFMFNVDCTRDELISRVLPRLKRLAQTENLAYKSIGSSKRCIFVIKEINSITIDPVIDKINALIIHNVSSYNNSIKSANITLKRANAANRGADTMKPLIPEANVKTYLSPFNKDTNYKLSGDIIIVDDNE